MKSKTNIYSKGTNSLGNKAFTLIELLAVIVILAIISLIAIPIVLNIIDSSKKASDKRSIELYAKAIQNSIADYALTHKGNYDSLVGIYTSDEFKNKLEINYNGNIDCDTIQIHKNGSVALLNCYLNGNKKIYILTVNMYLEFLRNIRK